MAFVSFLDLLRRRLALVILMPAVCALVVGAYAYLAVPDTYTATTSMYVLVKEDATQVETGSSLQSNLSASQMVSNDVATLLESSRIQKQTSADLGLSNLSGFDIRVTSKDASRVISVSVSGKDPTQVAAVANTMANDVSAIAQEVMNVQSVNIIDQADKPTSPSGPNRLLYVVVATLVGFLAAVAIADLANVLNNKVRNEHELEDLLGVPVVGRIPLTKGER